MTPTPTLAPSTPHPRASQTSAHHLTPQATDICALEQIPLDGGVCALVGGEQVAVFRLSGDRLYALSNIDPFTGASVLSRGIVGSRTVNGVARPKVASPLLKQNFDLETGACMDDPTVTVAVYDVKAENGRVLVGGRKPTG